MATTENVMEITEMTVREVTQALAMGDALKGAGIVAEILKSPCLPRTKKEKQVMVPVHVSPRKPLCTKLSMEEKGKAIAIEIDEEEEDLEQPIISEEEDEGTEEDTRPVHSAKKLHTYVPGEKGRRKYPRTWTRPRA